MPAVIPLFIPHEGCRERCAFCNQRYTANKAGGLPTPEAVQQEIADWLGRFRPGGAAPQLAFYGGSFTALPEARQRELLTAARPFLADGRISGIRLSTRPDCITEASLELLKAHGVELVELGVQSCDDAVLAASGRGHGFTASLKASRLIRAAGLGLGWQLLIGLPGERLSGIRRMAAECLAVRPDCARFYPLLVLRGSRLAEDWWRGAYRPLSLQKAVLLCAWLKSRLDAAGIPVIRMGLQAGPELERELLAGPYHPAFGELARARIMLRRARKLLARHGHDQETRTIHLNPRDLSAFIGERRANLERLEQLAGRGLIRRFRLALDPEQPRGGLVAV